jgi:hypothetical protein
VRVASSLEQALIANEGQAIEFKTSLSEMTEGVETVSAFANARGGDLFFGVTPDLRPVGIDIGKNTLENLANELRACIYPALPADIDELPVPGGKPVIRVSVPSDVPPIVGAYLASKQPIDPFKEVSTAGLQAYRRVGRTNQQSDFMQLRPQLRSDPLVLVDVREVTPAQVYPQQLSCTVWVADGSGLAHALRVYLEPKSLGQVFELGRVFPLPDGTRARGFNFGLDQQLNGPHEVWLLAEYRDDWGCTWQSGRLLVLKREGLATFTVTSEVFRQIVTFPPKRPPRPATAL